MPSKTSTGSSIPIVLGVKSTPRITLLLRAAARLPPEEARRVSAAALDKANAIAERYFRVGHWPPKHLEKAIFRLHDVYTVMGMRADRG